MNGPILDDDDALDERLRRGVRELTARSPEPPAWETLQRPAGPPRAVRALVAAAIVLFIAVLAGAVVMRHGDQRTEPGGIREGTTGGPTSVEAVEVTDVDEPGSFEVTATPLPDAGLGAREGASGVWTGRQYLVWGGWRGGTPAADGAAYDPFTGGWQPIPAAPIRGRQSHAAIWTGTEMIVWGGSPLPPGRGAPPGSPDGPLTDGAAYDPVTGTWRPIPPAPEATSSGLPVRALWVAEHLVIALDWDRSLPAEVAWYDPPRGSWMTSAAGFRDIAAVDGRVIGVREDRDRAEVTLGRLDLDSGHVDELARLPVPASISGAGLAPVPGGVVAVLPASSETRLATFDLAAGRWTAVRRAPRSSALDSFGMQGNVTSQLHHANAQVAVIEAGAMFVFDPTTATARVAALNRVHCVRPNAATVWTGREWYQFGGLGACGGNAVGVAGHAVRLTMR